MLEIIFFLFIIISVFIYLSVKKKESLKDKMPFSRSIKHEWNKKI